MTRTVRLRPLRAPERRLLATKLRDRTRAARLHQRYRIIDEVRADHPVAVIADRVGCTAATAYHWIHRFNASGFTTFERPTNPRGRIPIVHATQLRALVEVALSSPLARGLPFATWSVASLSTYCRAQGLLPEVSDEWVRRLLHRQGLTPQRIRTWKTSADPAFERKKTPFAASTAPARRARWSSASTNGGRSS